MKSGFFSLEGSAFLGLASVGPRFPIVSLFPEELTENKLKRGTSVAYIFIGSLGAPKELPGSEQCKWLWPFSMPPGLLRSGD